MKRYSFTIQGVRVNGITEIIPPSLNARVHWAVRNRSTVAWKEQVWWRVKALNIPRSERARIEITHFAIRPRDPDNFYASLKPILDGIVMARVIPDDSWDHIDLHAEPVKVGKRNEERVEVTIIV